MEKNIIIKNGFVFNENFKFVKKDIGISNGLITYNQIPDATIIDAAGKYIIPGLIDIHIHGAIGADASNGDVSQIKMMSDYLAMQGITSFCPTTMTFPEDVLEKAFCAINDFKKHQQSGAKVLGVNMEGPFFSMAKKGAQNPAYIKPANFDEFEKINRKAEYIVKIADIAPETEGAINFIEKASKTVTVSMAHTNASYETAALAIKSGATHCTHLFNAMPAYNHREPGVIGAVFESDSVMAELICDGVHVHPCVVRNTFKILGSDRVCAISDGLSSTGLDEGEYTLGGQKVFVKDFCARLQDGTLAGSARNLYLGFRNLISFGISLEDAIKSVTANPAKSIGEYDKIGSLEQGKIADLLILNNSYDIEQIFIDGNTYLMSAE